MNFHYLVTADDTNSDEICPICSSHEKDKVFICQMRVKDGREWANVAVI